MTPTNTIRSKEREESRLLLLGSSGLSTSLTHGEAVGALSLGAGSEDHVDVSSVVDLSLLCFTDGNRVHLRAAHVGLALLLLLDLGSLVLHLTGTSQRAVDLTTTAQTKHQMERGLLLNVVVRQSAAVLQLLAGEDQTLLIWGNSLLVLNLGLDVLDGIRGLDVERDGLSCVSLSLPNGSPVSVFTKICMSKCCYGTNYEARQSSLLRRVLVRRHEMIGRTSSQQRSNKQGLN